MSAMLAAFVAFACSAKPDASITDTSDSGTVVDGAPTGPSDAASDAASDTASSDASDSSSAADGSDASDGAIAPRCGDTNQDPGEQCEDSNTTKCDGCESCQYRRWLTLPAAAFATVPGITAALPRGSMCVEAWAKVSAPASGDAVVVSSYGSGANGAFLLRCQNLGATVGRLVFAHEAGGPVVQAEANGTTCNDGAWHHLAGCRAVVGTTVTNTVFLDGVLKATGSGDAATIGANANVVFGGVTYGADGLLGAIDEVRISTGLRYTGTFVPVRRHAVDASTLALWHLDEGTGTTFADVSGNAYSGTLGTGADWAVDTGYSVALCQ